MKPSDADIISQHFGSPVKEAHPLTGGCIAPVFRVTLQNGQKLVAKCSDGSFDLTVEGQMLRYLATETELPVPDIHIVTANLLVMDLVPNDGSLTAAAQEDAARHLAHLHALPADRFGFEWNTLIGPIAQPNPQSDLWIPFFRDYRLLYMAGLAADAERLPASILSRIYALAERLDDFLIEPDRPCLIHGDLWTGNILCFENKISGFIDPALYVADPEIELAYTTLFSTFGAPFFDAYQEHRPLKPGFFEGRRDLYNLYPLLVHVRLFGGHYVASVDTTLRKFGF